MCLLDTQDFLRVVFDEPRLYQWWWLSEYGKIWRASCQRRQHNDPNVRKSHTYSPSANTKWQDRTFFNIDINPGPPLTTPFIPLHTPLCGLVDNVTTPDGQYTVYNNEWGVLVYIAKGVPYNGTQCSVVDALPDADSIAWTVNYRWVRVSLSFDQRWMIRTD